MSCEDARRVMSTCSIREIGALTHLEHCEDCRELARVLVEQEEQMYANVTEWVEAPRPERPAAGRNLWGGALLLAAAAALWLIVAPDGSTERRGTMPGAPVPEVREPTALLPEGTPRLDIAVGTGVALGLPKAPDSVAVEPPIARAVRVGPEQRLLHVFGTAPGEAVLSIRWGGAEPLRYLVAVAPAPTEVSPEDRGDARLLSVGGTTVVKLRQEPVGVSSSDEGVVAVAGYDDGGTRMTLRGVGPGVAEIVVAYAEGPPDVQVVQVGP